jgi:hypothetical protein
MRFRDADAIRVDRIAWATMDRSVKATLWIAAMMLLGYAAWAYANCAMDAACHVEFCGPRGAPCGFSRHAP